MSSLRQLDVRVFSPRRAGGLMLVLALLGQGCGEATERSFNSNDGGVAGGTGGASAIDGGTGTGGSAVDSGTGGSAVDSGTGGSAVDSGPGDSGSASCDADYFGSSCELCTCENGACDDGADGNGECTSCDANTGWSGNNCSTCDSNWTGGSCDVCTSGNFGNTCAVCTCDHGTCDDGVDGDGECDAGSCTTGWAGVNCDSCADDYWGASCDAACTCDRGTCDVSDGECQTDSCDDGWSGENCDVCDLGVTVGSVYNSFELLDVTFDVSAPAGAFNMYAPVGTDNPATVTLRNGDSDILGLDYNWQTTVGIVSYTFVFPGYFSITVTRAVGTSNLYGMPDVGGLFTGDFTINTECK